MIRNLIGRSINQRFKKNMLSLRAIHDIRRPQAERKILGVFESQIGVEIKSVNVKPIAMIGCRYFNPIPIASSMNSCRQLVEKPRLSIDRHPQSSPGPIHRSRPAVDIAEMPRHSLRGGFLEEQASSGGQSTNTALIKP